VTDIIKEIIKQNVNSAIVVSGDFINKISHMYRELHFLGFTYSRDPYTITDRLGRHFDQIFARGVDITNALVNDGFDSGVTDHRCLRVSLKFK
jgi:hypothetical protein